MHFLPFLTIKTLTLRMDHAKLLDVLTSLPVSRLILPRAVYFATSRPANHAICSFIDSSGYAPIRRCLFIDYIITSFIRSPERKALVCGVYCDFVTFPFGILVQVFYLIVSLSFLHDLCHNLNI